MIEVNPRHQFLYDQHGNRTAVLIPIKDYNAAFHVAPQLNVQSQRWLEADMGEELPEYEWGGNEPGGISIQYEAGAGFLISRLVRSVRVGSHSQDRAYPL